MSNSGNILAQSRTLESYFFRRAVFWGFLRFSTAILGSWTAISESGDCNLRYLRYFYSLLSLLGSLWVAFGLSGRPFKNALGKTYNSTMAIKLHLRLNRI